MTMLTELHLPLYLRFIWKIARNRKRSPPNRTKTVKIVRRISKREL